MLLDVDMNFTFVGWRERRHLNRNLRQWYTGVSRKTANKQICVAKGSENVLQTVKVLHKASTGRGKMSTESFLQNLNRPVMKLKVVTICVGEYF